MSSTLVDYKGLQVPAPHPANLGGSAIENNFTKTVDWNPPSVWTQTTDPDTSADINAGYYPGSRWLNTTTAKVWTCVDNTPGSAEWQLGGGSGSPTQTFVVASQAAMLALPAQQGDFAVRTDLSESFVLTTNDPTILVNWQELLSPPDIVTSVNGQTGVVVLTKSDIGLSNVTNALQLVAANNLSDLTSVSSARTNLGLGTIATQNANTVSITGGTINGATVTGLPSPSSGSDAATKTYVDGAIQGLQVKPTAAVATTAALPANTYNNGSSGVGATLTATSNGALTVDGYSVTASDIILVKNESTASRNGLYTVTQAGDGSHPYILTRHTDMDQSAEFPGAFVPVGNAGTANANSLWLANPSTPVTVGTTSIPFTQLNGATDLTAGTGITISGNTVSINTSWPGQTAITTLGTISAGTWQGSPVGIAYGGTGATTAAAALDNLAGVTLNGSAYVIPTRTNSATTNGTNLLAAYTAAKALTPFGSALSATNRAAVLLLPGKYDLGTGSLTLDTQFVDLIGVAAPENVVITSACNGASTGTVMQTADDVLLQAITLICTSSATQNTDATDPAAYFPTTALANAKLRWVNTTATNNGWGMRLVVQYKGTYQNCTNTGDYGFSGNAGTASGTFTDCVHIGHYGFGGGPGGTASGTFTNCTHAGSFGFAGLGGNASGTFTDCIHTGDDGFGGGGGAANGTFTDCTHTGVNGFAGSSGFMDGTMIRCESTGQLNCFVTGRIENCRIVATGTNENAIAAVIDAILKDCVLVATGTGKCFDAGSPSNVKIYGTVMTNAPKGSNVTIIAGGSLIVDSNVS